MMTARSIGGSAILVLLTSTGCEVDTGGHGPRAFAPTTTVALDCRTTPEAITTLDPTGRILFTEERVSTDGGATWRFLYSGTERFEGYVGPTSLGDGRWLVRDGFDQHYILDPETGRAPPVALELTDGPAAQFRAGVAGDLHVAVDQRGRVWTSADGASWQGRDGEFYTFAFGVTYRTWARGERVWSLTNEGVPEVSTDGGRRFAPRETPLGADGINDLSLGSGARVAALVAFGGDGWVALSDDDGATWRLAEGDPEWIIRMTPGGVRLLADDTIMLFTSLNVDAAYPNGAGFALLRSLDWGGSWEILSLTNEGSVTRPRPSVWSLADGSVALVDERRDLCRTIGEGAGTRTTSFVDAVERAAPERPTFTSPADLATVGAAFEVTGRTTPGAVVDLELTGLRQERVTGACLSFEDVTPTASVEAGPDGVFAASFDTASYPEGEALGVNAWARDGYLTSPVAWLAVTRSRAGVELEIEAPAQGASVGSTVRLVGTGPAGASLRAWLTARTPGVVAGCGEGSVELMLPDATVPASGRFDVLAVVPAGTSLLAPSGMGMVVHASRDGDTAAWYIADLAFLPPACPATPAVQSPASFESGALSPEPAPTCDTAGTEWRPCHQHLHCGPEHSGAGICPSAACEVHTVHRRRKDGGDTEAVEALHEGTVAGNCAPADHDLLVVATFVSFASADCRPEGVGLTYCGSATGNDTLDADGDGAVTCAEAGVNPTSVRWCVETGCVCKPGSTPESEAQSYGELEATKVQGCPGP